MAEIKVIMAKTKNCNLCQGLGYSFSLSTSNRNFNFLEICSCVEKTCICDKKVPYVYLDEDTRQLTACPCRPYRLKVDQIKELVYSSKIPKKYQFRRITEFDTSNDNEEISMNLIQAHDNAYYFIEQFSPDYTGNTQGLYFYGNAGSGKTMLACLILNELILQYQIEVCYIKITRDFFNQLRSTFNAESALYGQGDDLFKTISLSRVLVIDDFGVQADSEWEQRTLYDLIDARYEAELPTLITSNTPPQELESSFKNRIYSRLREMTLFQSMIGLDYREKFRPIQTD